MMHQFDVKTTSLHTQIEGKRSPIATEDKKQESDGSKIIKRLKNQFIFWNKRLTKFIGRWQTSC